MEKYRVFEKLKKTRHCSYYNAENLINHEIVTIKKLSRNNNWEELLAKRQIALMKQQNLPFLAKIKEIIKENGKFFVVHEPLTQCVDDLKKKSLSLTDIANIGKQMIEISLNLMKEGVTLAELRPEFYFVNRKRVKLAHIVSLSSDEEKEQEQGRDYKYYSPEVTLNNKMTNPEQSNIFSIGLILCELMLGRPLIQAKNKLDYMYILCSLFPRQKLDHSSAMQSQGPTQTLKTFQDIMEPVCPSEAFLDLLGEMTKVNAKGRLNLTEAFKKIRGLQSKLDAQEQEKNSPKKKTESNIDKNSVFASMSKITKEINDERYRISPSNPQRNKNRLITMNNEINIPMENEVYDKVGFMPRIPRECKVLKTEKNVQDNAHLSHIVHKKTQSDFIIPIDPKSHSPFNKNFPLVRTSARFSQSNPKRHKANSSTGRIILQKTLTSSNHTAKRVHLAPQKFAVIKTQPPTQNLHETQKIKTKSLNQTQKVKVKVPQLTNYARNSNQNLGLEIAPDGEFQSQSEFE